MQDYRKFVQWAVVHIVGRETQDDHRDKLSVEALFEYPTQAEDIYLPNMANKDIPRYIIHVDDLEKAESFYNAFRDGRGLENFTEKEADRFTYIFNL